MCRKTCTYDQFHTHDMCSEIWSYEAEIIPRYRNIYYKTGMNEIFTEQNGWKNIRFPSSS